MEEVILNHDGRRGIRLDAWAKEAGDKGRHFGTEMQNDTTTDHIPKRARFYQGLMDSPMLKSGRATKYRSLPPTVVSFITPNDIFGRDLARYTFTEQCEELPGLHLEDGTTKIFLNMASKNGDPALVSLLQYMKHTTLENPDVETIDDRIRKLDEVVNEVRESEEWENVRMSILSIGIEQGKREGLAQGLERGRRDALRQQVLKKLTKGKTAVQIADEIEEEVSVVEELITELQGERES